MLPLTVITGGTLSLYFSEVKELITAAPPNAAIAFWIDDNSATSLAILAAISPLPLPDIVPSLFSSKAPVESDTSNASFSLIRLFERFIRSSIDILSTRFSIDAISPADNSYDEFVSAYAPIDVISNDNIIKLFIISLFYKFIQPIHLYIYL